ncbi:putative aliphatic sulfonates transport permease protein SsuC [Hartmannibacter diazotrophicus]|uniref:Putative aliphatic sulfonates transport permease protein SsuC n=1 Tax=Hartmannibacter diazotrophicus TaxID=1482074 RepID=A0A2C9DB29_9HYPH|nr:ABC transporter permease [Hartmannibacter diazotrophicus]SON56805.1 putative aliphatic sulfonates transport permease protein SsuC [Hartmannibacter diazotrophicus]
MVARRLTDMALSAWPVVAGLAALLLVWEGSVRLFDIPTFVLPGPFAILGTMVLKSGSLLPQLAITLGEALGGFGIGSVIGLAFAIVLVLAPPLERALLPIVVMLNSVPSVAFVPLALIWFGLGVSSKIALAALAVSFAVLLNALQGLKKPEAESINLMRSFGAGPLGILWRLRLPAAMPAIVTGLRVGLARSTIAVIVAEMMGAYAGIGQVIYQSTAQIDYLAVWAAVFLSSLGSLALYGVLTLIDNRLVWWR